MSDIVERLEACLDIPEVPSSVCRAISEAADLIISLRALVATPKPEAEPVDAMAWREGAVTDEMVRAALLAFQCGDMDWDSQDEELMRLALVAALRVRWGIKQ